MARQTLTTYSPCPSATRYTVTAAPPHTSLLVRALCVIAYALRAAAALLCVAGLALHCAGAAGTPASGRLAWLAASWETHFAAYVDAELAPTGAWWWAVPAACCMAAWALARRYDVEESLLVIRGLGIQTSTSPSTHLSSATTRFIPASQIQDIFIHEAFIGFEVRFYLAVVVAGEQQAVVVFPQLLPRREVVEQVWRGSRAVLGWSKEAR